MEVGSASGAGTILHQFPAARQALVTVRQLFDPRVCGGHATEPNHQNQTTHAPRSASAVTMQQKRKWLRRGFLGKARSEARGISFMDLAALHDEVLARKAQANTCVYAAWLRLRPAPVQFSLCGPRPGRLSPAASGSPTSWRRPANDPPPRGWFSCAPPFPF